METFNLLEKYLKENVSRTDIELIDYLINGSIIKLKYSYLFIHSTDNSYTMHDVTEVELLDYITFIYNQLNEKSL